MERHDNSYFDQVEDSLMTHEITPKDRLQNQIQLARDLFLVIQGEEMLPNESRRDFKNRIMNYWNNEGYSELYCEIETSTEFEVHPRLQGDIFKITPADMIYYKDNGHLPEN